MNETAPRAMNGKEALALSGIIRSFVTGTQRLDVLKGASLDLRGGEVVALVGPSGSGKSTLLHVAGLLETPDAGEVAVGGKLASKLSDRERTAIRRRELGFVYQFHHLLPEFTALENVVLPQLIAGAKRRPAEEWAATLLGRLGLDQRLDHRPTRLSGGEQQRVAIARALANRPRTVLADEPTGNLDPKTAIMVMEGLISLARDEGVAALVATHNLELAARMDRIVVLQEGRLVPSIPER